ncbi:MAG: efflux RND transporter permease subunit [Thermochromatium sp.]
MTSDQQFQITLQTQGRLTEVEEFERILMRANPDSSRILVRDLGRVERDARQSDVVSRLDGRPTAAMAIYLTPGANAVAVADRVRVAMKKLAERFPNDLDYAVVYDTTDFVKASLRKVVHTLFEAFVLVILVVFLFLGSWRAALIPLIAVPVALIGSLAFLLLIGFLLNTISLLAMVLAIGIVVDDAIVVVENVERLMQEEGLSPRAAAKKAMGQITGPIIAITLVLVLIAGIGLATGWLFKITPTGFLPIEDQGAFMAHVQLPEGASVNRTLVAVEQIERIVLADPAVQHVIAIPGYNSRCKASPICSWSDSTRAGRCRWLCCSR